MRILACLLACCALGLQQLCLLCTVSFLFSYSAPCSGFMHSQDFVITAQVCTSVPIFSTLKDQGPCITPPNPSIHPSSQMREGVRRYMARERTNPGTGFCKKKKLKNSPKKFRPFPKQTLQKKKKETASTPFLPKCLYPSLSFPFPGVPCAMLPMNFGSELYLKKEKCVYNGHISGSAARREKKGKEEGSKCTKLAPADLQYLALPYLTGTELKKKMRR